MPPPTFPPLETAKASQEPGLVLDDQAMSEVPSPAEPDASVTPFLERPSEIRNFIYKALFEPDEPKVLVLCGQTIPGKTEELRLRIAGIELLYTCRQIYSEAASILYGSSSFVAPPVSQNASLGRDYLCPVGAWLARIGDKRGLLKNLEIHLTESVPRSSGYFELNPLVRFMFGTSKANQVLVSFSFKEQGVSTGLLDAIDATPLNLLLSQMLKHSQVKTLLRCWRRVQSVSVSSIGTRLQLKMQSGSDHDSHIFLGFSNSDDGQLRYSPEPGRGLQSIMKYQNVAQRVYKDQEVTFDLDHRKVSPAWPKLLHVSRAQRLASFIAMWQQEKHLRLRTVNEDRSNDAFATLQKIDELEKRYLLTAGQDRFILDIHVDARADLTIENIRINAVCLVSAACVFSRLFIPDIRIHLGGQATTLGAQEPLLRIKGRLFQFLIHLLRTYPDFAHSPCPFIWMDSECRIREAEFRETGLVIRNDKYACTKELTSEQLGFDDLESTLTDGGATPQETMRDGSTLINFAFALRDSLVLPGLRV